MSDIKAFDDLFQNIFLWATQDKIFHYGKKSGTFSIGNTITGSISGATGTVTYVGTGYLRYTKTGSINFQKNDIVTNGSGGTCTAKNVNEFHNDVADRIYFQEAPEETLPTILPYAVFQFVGEIPNDSYTGKSSKILIKWNIFTSDSSSVPLFNILSDLQTLFDFPELLFTNWDFVSFLRSRTSPVLKDANKIWYCSIDYTLIVQQKK